MQVNQETNPQNWDEKFELIANTFNMSTDQRQNWRVSNRPMPQKCFTCKEEGHRAADCPYADVVEKAIRAVKAERAGDRCESEPLNLINNVSQFEVPIEFTCNNDSELTVETSNNGELAFENKILISSDVRMHTGKSTQEGTESNEERMELEIPSKESIDPLSKAFDAQISPIHRYEWNAVPSRNILKNPIFLNKKGREKKNELAPLSLKMDQ
ncbi:hypothetical protein BCR33DRAFT_717050 [Rhizoclosmatium globosum]|uniref:CCHC-type domain-containing protein n=1 Tax=Rhizoclosmatium globosum TaxID=329046 RepID=A0A1Y2CBW1_9FUNG|nr:hypothetical protein BCR33DRAFT_717050 [Rhizoclosmatium globosum]|eukprot:ORY44541.1 hypothetical protein BCR33DRAFT_717050 [Rhizoclosmatium globosum]